MCRNMDMSNDVERRNFVVNYYIIQFNDEKNVKYAIWYTDEEDGFVSEHNKILFFDYVESLKEFCDNKNIIILDDKISCVYDFGYLKKWLLSPNDRFNCSIMLDFWNIISDASKSMGVEFIGDDKENDATNQLYLKLFHGCNLPAINTSRKKYIPKWTQKEIESLADILSAYKVLWS